MTCETTTEHTRVRNLARWRGCVITMTLLVHVAFSFLHYAEPQRDAAEYHALAVSLATTGTYGLPGGDTDAAVRPTARRMPLYPLLLAAIYAAVGVDQGLSAAPVAQALLVVFNIALVIAIARRFFGDAPALLAGVLVCFYQAYLFLPTELLSENLSLTLLLLALFLLTRAAGRHVPNLAAAFVVLGLLVLTRANAIVLLPAAGVWAWQTLRGAAACQRLRNRISLNGQREVSLAWQGRAAKLALCAVCFLAPLIPWWVRNAITFGRFVPLSTNGGWNFYLGHNEAYRRWPGLGEGTDYAIFERLLREGRSEIEADRELYARGLTYAGSHPAETAANLFRKAGVMFSVATRQTWNLIFLALIVIGILALRSPPGRTVHKGTGAVLVGAGLLLWVGQAATLLLAQNKGLAGVGISFGLLALTAVAGLVIALRHNRGHWLLPALYLSQVAVGLIYIPIVRIRWSVDFIVMMYAAVAVWAAAARVLPRLWTSRAGPRGLNSA